MSVEKTSFGASAKAFWSNHKKEIAVGTGLTVLAAGILVGTAAFLGNGNIDKGFSEHALELGLGSAGVIVAAATAILAYKYGEKRKAAKEEEARQAAFAHSAQAAFTKTPRRVGRGKSGTLSPNAISPREHVRRNTPPRILHTPNGSYTQ